MAKCGWCITSDHDTCWPYVIGPAAQVWWCDCDCDKERKNRHKDDAERESKKRKDDLAWFEPVRRRRRRRKEQ